MENLVTRPLPTDIRDLSTCRFCGDFLTRVFLDLGASPLANSYLTTRDLTLPEPFFPLRVFVCDACLLVQLPEAERPEQIFSDYAYFSSYSDSWLAHAESFAAMAVERFGLGPTSRVVEVASNDGYLLRFFHQRKIPVLGIEPAANVARAAEELGIPTLVRFFSKALGEELAAGGQRADLLVGNNVLAHVPELNDFVAGLTAALKPTGVLTMEFPHLLQLIAENQFDTIYHEHYSYFSATVVQMIFDTHGLVLFDVEELPTHGGSLRVYAHRKDGPQREISPAVGELLARETAVGLTELAGHDGFAPRVQKVKRDLLRFLLTAQEEGRQVVGYGAPAKGNTLLNYCGIREDLLTYTVDRSPHKQNHYLPGVRIPIHAPERILKTRPDYVLILPWNLKKEIVEQMREIRTWGGQFVVAVPHLEVF